MLLFDETGRLVSEGKKMKIKDITLSENLHTITMAMENNAGDFDTEDRLLRELLEKVKEMDQALHGDG